MARSKKAKRRKKVYGQKALLKKPELDLHGVKHCDAPRVIHRFINANWHTKAKQLKIITGHSHTMQSIVLQTVEEYQLRCSIGVNKATVMVWI